MIWGLGFGSFGSRKLCFGSKALTLGSETGYRRSLDHYQHDPLKSLCDHNKLYSKTVAMALG